MRALLVISFLLSCKQERAEPPAARPEPAVAAKPAYSPQAAARALDELASCTSEVNCKPMDRLVEFGPVAGAALVAYVSDATKPAAQRHIAAIAIGKLRVAGAGAKLVALASHIDEFLVRGDYYEAAGACGGDDTFAALAAEYERYAKHDEGDSEPRKGLRAFPEQTMRWATTNLAAAKTHQSRWADLIVEVATDASAVVKIIVSTKLDVFSTNRLAGKAIALGDTDERLFDLLIASLELGDKYYRADAVNMLDPIADKIPPSKHAKIVALTKRALAQESDPTYSRRMQDTLAKLGG